MIKLLLAQQAYTGDKFKSDLSFLIVVLVSFAGALMTLYAVYIAYIFATATDEGKRRASKERLFKVLGSALIIFALAATIEVIDVNFNNVKVKDPTNDAGNNQVSGCNVYEYTEIPSFTTMSPGKPCEVVFSTNKIRIKDGTTVSGAKLLDCKIEGLDGEYTVNGNGSSITYRVTCPSSLTVFTKAQGGKTLYVLYASASFSYNGDVETVNFCVQVNTPFAPDIAGPYQGA